MSEIDVEEVDWEAAGPFCDLCGWSIRVLRSLSTFQGSDLRLCRRCERPHCELCGYRHHSATTCDECFRDRARSGRRCAKWRRWWS